MTTPYSFSGAVPLRHDCGKQDAGPRIQRIETFCTPLIGFVRVTAEDALREKPTLNGSSKTA